MKKLCLIISFLLASHLTKAQITADTNTGAAFETAMLENIRQLDSASSTSEFVRLANSFERIAAAEKLKWQPFYYAAYCYTAMAFMSPDKTKIDDLADRAEAILQQAGTIEPNNAEVSCLFAMINSCRIMVDPVNRFQTKGKEVQAMLQKAKAENIDNPRIYLLEARMQLRTPEAFGGGKKIARESAEKAVAKFNNFIPHNAMAPNWGKGQAESLLAKINAAN